jgi:hypothetical protein
MNSRYRYAASIIARNARLNPVYNAYTGKYEFPCEGKW